MTSQTLYSSNTLCLFRHVLPLYIAALISQYSVMDAPSENTWLTPETQARVAATFFAYSVIFLRRPRASLH